MAVNEKVLDGNWSQIKDKLHERWGHLSNDELESAHGSVEQLTQTIEQRTGEARESIERYLEELTEDAASTISKAAATVREYAGGAQETAKHAAQKAADSVKAGYTRTEKTIRRRPIESLAVCFGTGLITGVVLGLLMGSRK